MNAVILAAKELSMAKLDIIVIAVYFLVIIGIGCWSGMRRRGGTESKGYFLAGGTLTWPLIGLALFSTNISTIHMVGFAQEGYLNGLAYGNFEWMAPFLLIVLALFFAPFYLRSKVATLPDFLEKRYSRGCRDWLAGLSIVSAIFIHIGFTLYTGAVVLKGLFGIPIMTSVVMAAILTGIYTILGGLLAVVVTGSIQTIVLLAGSICITVMALYKVGGWEGLTEYVEPMKLTILRGDEDPAHLPWYSVFLGYPIIGLWYWCADQTIVQRVLGAKDENHARTGPLFAGFLKILPVFIFFLPGLIVLALANKGVFAPLEDSKDTYAFAITELLPAGLTGLMAAALLAALMSTVSGALNSIATLFSYDLYKRWRPDTPDHKLVLIGRVATFIAMIFAIFWSPLIAKFESIYQGSNAVICYIAPPITTVFIFGVFWRRASSKAAIYTLFLGSFLGLLVFFLDWYSEKTGWDVPFMMASFYLFVVCSLIMFLVSLIKPHEHDQESEKLVWKSPMEALRSPGWKGIGNYKMLSIVLFIAMVVFYYAYNRLHPRQPENPTQVTAGSLHYAYYQGNWEKLPELDTLTPNRQGHTSKIDLTSVSKDENYILKFSGYLNVSQEGPYIFYVQSKQDYILRIGKITLPFYEMKEKYKVTIDKDKDKEKWARINLSPGKHAITLIVKKSLMKPFAITDIIDIAQKNNFSFSLKNSKGKETPLGVFKEEKGEDKNTYKLPHGKFEIKIDCRQVPMEQYLKFRYEGPGIEKTEFPAEVLFHENTGK